MSSPSKNPVESLPFESPLPSTEEHNHIEMDSDVSKSSTPETENAGGTSVKESSVPEVITNVDTLIDPHPEKDLDEQQKIDISEPTSPEESETVPKPPARVKGKSKPKGKAPVPPVPVTPIPTTTTTILPASDEPPSITKPNHDNGNSSNEKEPMTSVSINPATPPSYEENVAASVSTKTDKCVQGPPPSYEEGHPSPDGQKMDNVVTRETDPQINPQLNTNQPILQVQTISNKKYLPMELYVTIVSGFSFLCIGLLRAYTSPAIASMEDDHVFFSGGSGNTMSKSVVSWVAASPPLASFFGTILSGLALQYCGRQKTLMLLTIPYIAGWLLIGFATNVSMIMTGRALTGLAAGFSTAVAQLYISECVRANVRGFLGFFPAMMLSLGILLGFSMSTINLEWQELALVMTTFPILLLLFSIALPESPSWLLCRGKEKEAIESLRKLRGLPSSDACSGDGGKSLEIQKEIDDIKRVINKRHYQGPITNGLEQGAGGEDAEPQDFVQFIFKDLLGKREIWFPAFVSASLMVFQQFTGANAVIFYLSIILNEASPKNSNGTDFFNNISGKSHNQHGGLDPNVSSVIVGLVQFFAFFLSLPLIDRLGRRVLLIISAVFMVFPHFILGLYFWVKMNPSITIHVYSFASITKFTSSWLPLTCLCGFIASYSIGFGPVPFIIMSEIFPSYARSYMCAIASLVNHLTVFFIIRLFPTLMDWFGPHVIFWMFSVFCALAAIHVAIVVPETKGKTLTEIELEFLGVTKGDESSKGKNGKQGKNKETGGKNHAKGDCKCNCCEN